MSSSSTVIITGGSSGLGLAAARRFLADGYQVVLGGRDDARLKQAEYDLSAGDRVATVAGDIGAADTGQRLVRTAVDRFGGVDVLVNSAGTFAAKPFLDVTGEELDGFLAGNLRGTYLTTQAVVRRMVAQGRGGCVVNIGTVLNDHAVSGFPASAALVSKGGIRALTVALAAELAPNAIRVNEVAPGVVRTPLHAAVDVDAFAGLAVLDRVGEADEIAEAVHYLATAQFVTGHTLAVDGGFVTVRS
ncbi:glucose dehydrogenase [Actinoplanes sp. SE50]|uniref:SDR family NAD(P)-dependent oxidoreductase n=1 Tax=unclassified Actinoplanes TaxID=2626549 RepID=UPI00023EBF3C|nr:MULTISPECIES: SDR family oxidoreductase [unclassified Actinoplanes]AEV85147.1 short-chain dehydrogenase/reductase SDR [Actinoplanes sp. SE50/110]ATO83538.1 glucose dehydrogenase [Actinoplanes sp. SE50]SLM00945.1 glucose dehydrogenase [Actinoplanes sp. SE50/110]